MWFVTGRLEIHLLSRTGNLNCKKEFRFGSIANLNHLPSSIKETTLIRPLVNTVEIDCSFPGWLWRKMFSGGSKSVEISTFIEEAQTSAFILSLVTEKVFISATPPAPPVFLFWELKCQMFPPTWTAKSRKILGEKCPVEVLLTEDGRKSIF